MHRRISTLLHRLRQDLAATLGTDFILAACLAAGHTWSDAALLTPPAIIHWFLIQILHGNTSLTHVSLLAGRAFSDAAFCMARARLPLAVFQAVLRHMVRAVIPDTEAIGRWRGHRTFLVNGSSFSMPDTPVLQDHFGQPGNQAKGCGFPAAHRLALGGSNGDIAKSPCGLGNLERRSSLPTERPPPPIDSTITVSTDTVGAEMKKVVSGRPSLPGIRRGSAPARRIQLSSFLVLAASPFLVPNGTSHPTFGHLLPGGDRGNEGRIRVTV